jgi:hypothetical protein
MEKLIKPARIAFCIGLAGMVIPQFFYGKFGVNFFPAWPGLPWVAFWSCLFTLAVIAAAAAIILEKNGRTVSLILGGMLLAVYCFGYIPYELIISPYYKYLGTWGDGLKESALAGGAFVVAGTFPKKVNAKSTPMVNFLEKLIPLGPLFFCITMVLYGISHFLYTKYISPLVPAWFPGSATFWTYFGGAALIGLGLAIMLRIKQRLAAALLGLMILIWLFIIHIPSVFSDPYGGNSNSVVSAFSALAFIAIAFLIAGVAARREKR